MWCKTYNLRKTSFTPFASSTPSLRHVVKKFFASFNYIKVFFFFVLIEQLTHISYILTLAFDLTTEDEKSLVSVYSELFSADAARFQPAWPAPSYISDRLFLMKQNIF